MIVRYTIYINYNCESESEICLLIWSYKENVDMNIMLNFAIGRRLEWRQHACEQRAIHFINS